MENTPHSSVKMDPDSSSPGVSTSEDRLESDEYISDDNPIANHSKTPMRRRKPLTAEQRKKKSIADYIYRASLTTEKREKIKEHYRKRWKNLTEDQRRRRKAAQVKYRAKLTPEQLLLRKIRNRERVKVRNNIELVDGKIQEVVTIKKWTTLSPEQREKRDAFPRTYGSRLSKEQRELKRLELLENSKMLISESLNSAVNVKNENVETIKTISKEESPNLKCENIERISNIEEIPSSSVSVTSKIMSADKNPSLPVCVKNETVEIEDGDLFEIETEWISWVKQDSEDLNSNMPNSST